MSTRIAVVIVLATTLSYFHMVYILKEQSLSQLEKYVTERGYRERIPFQLAEANHQILKRDLLATLDDLGDSDPIKAFDTLLVQHRDGVTRNRPELFDGTQQTGIYIDADLPIDADIRRRVLTFYNLCNRYGPAWHSQFQDTYITTPENIMAIYWPEVPTWCQDANANLYMPDEEYVWVADLKHNPARKVVWTGLFYDHVAKIWMVSCETPVDVEGKHIATIGHDITLNELVERTLNDRIDGTFNMICRDDGHLIAHPDRMQEIQEHEGSFDIAKSGDLAIQAIIKAVKSREEGVIIIDSPENDAYLAVTTIDEPGWYFITVFPKKILTAQALKSASFILLLGVASLLIELIVLFIVLRRQVASRLNGFMDAIANIAKGQLDIHLDDQQDDELGRLAHSFNTMARTIASRDKELEQRRDQLENQVVQRTEALGKTMKELELLATTDKLTKLPNRRVFLDRLNQTMKQSRRDGSRFAVLFFDFDRFKVVNDSLGHGVGDSLLCAIADIFRKILRDVDTVARFGGDEFVVLLGNLENWSDAETKAEHFLDAFSKPHELSGHLVVSTASIGLVTNKSEYECADNMIQDADTALYKAKDNGKAQCVCNPPHP